MKKIEVTKEKKKKSKENPFPLCLLHVSTHTHKGLFHQHSHFSTSAGCDRGFWRTGFTKTKFPNLVQWLKIIWQYQWFNHWLYLPITCAPVFSLIYSYSHNTRIYELDLDTRVMRVNMGQILTKKLTIKYMNLY